MSYRRHTEDECEHFGVRDAMVHGIEVHDDYCFLHCEWCPCCEGCSDCTAHDEEDDEELDS